MKNSISIVIVNWNGETIIENCLRSIYNQTVLADEVIVVDNGSKDSSLKKVKKFSGIKIVELGENHGFAKASNIGFDKAKGEFIFALNNDTVLAKDCLENILKAIEKDSDRIGMYSLKMLYRFSSKIDTLGLSVNSLGISSDIKEEDNIKKLVGPCGGAAIYRKEMLQNIKDENGYFDERFFIYFEDVDLALRAKAVGWQAKYISSATVYHLHGATTGKNRDPFLYFFFRNRILCFHKKKYSFGLNLLFILLNVVVILKYTLKGKFALSYRAITDGFSARIKDPKEIFANYS